MTSRSAFDIADTPQRASPPPLIVGIGGTISRMSSPERALRIALAEAERLGLRTKLFGGADLAQLPHYDPKAGTRSPSEHTFVDAIREASALIVASPGYHGGISGLVKNALDLLEETAHDPRPYLSDMPVGLIATAYGWQATGSTITALRSVVHALRGWPTPFAAAINSRDVRFDEQGGASDAAVLEQIRLVGRQVARFALLTRPGSNRQFSIHKENIFAVE